MRKLITSLLLFILINSIQAQQKTNNKMNIKQSLKKKLPNYKTSMNLTLFNFKDNKVAYERHLKLWQAKQGKSMKTNNNEKSIHKYKEYFINNEKSSSTTRARIKRKDARQ